MAGPSARHLTRGHQPLVPDPGGHHERELLGLSCGNEEDRARSYFENEVAKQVGSLDEERKRRYVSLAADGQIDERILPEVVLRP